VCFGTAFEEILVMGGMVLDVAIQIRRCADGMMWCFKDQSVCETGKL